MLITNYQMTEAIIGTFLFPLLYFLYLYFSNSTIRYWDILWCTIVLGMIMFLRNMYMNYYILQDQNNYIYNM